MLLAIDAGNTNIVFALVDTGAGEGAGTIRARWRIATDPRRTADQYAVWLHQLLELEGLERGAVTSVIIGTVVPRALHNLEVLSVKYFHCTPLIAGQGVAAWPIALDVDEPGSVGADRVLNAIAARDRFDADNLVVIDFGTATTFDLVDRKGAYRGGIIAPGINLSLDALVQAAAKLPRIAIEAPSDRSVIGRNTEAQMRIGVFWGYVAMIEGLLERIKAELDGPVSVIGTGGLALLFDKHTNVFDVVEPDLTIHGLALLAKGADAR
ncbi:type III pantothenate kinase [Sphingomonas mesophila]|uniref:type III pantothenate kinase n=1 Tax=Sphingomonas mesophila TaxID=2303576 RepID=UPI000E5959D3|nr:type III pantothenate kinase [Sphingomonas mesophila]